MTVVLLDPKHQDLLPFAAAKLVNGPVQVTEDVSASVLWALPHAEVAVGDRWLVLDSTRLAPRPTLVRIGTGRDAADTAFCSTVEGYAELTTAMVGASTDTDLPYDDHLTAVAMP